MPASLDGPDLVLGRHDAGLAALIATEVTLLRAVAATQPDVRVEVRLGWHDILDGFDESYIHARVVELLDAVASLVPPTQVVVRGVPGRPEATATQELLRRQVDGGAAVTARLRGQAYVPGPPTPPSAGGPALQ